jgi:hypothetical protein
MRRRFGLDVRREVAEVAIYEEGVVRLTGRIEATPAGAAAVRRQALRSG